MNPEHCDYRYKNVNRSTIVSIATWSFRKNGFLRDEAYYALRLGNNNHAHFCAFICVPSLFVVITPKGLSEMPSVGV